MSEGGRSMSTGPRVMVSGAGAGGIGGEICRKLARDAAARGERARIVACVTGAKQDIHDLVTELREIGADAIGLSGDLADPAVPDRLVHEAVAFCGGLDGLVANAALRSDGPLLGLAVSEWDEVFAVNTRAIWLLARAAHPALKESRGAIVAITSIAGMYPHVNFGAYPPSKAALINLCQTLASEFASDGIRVNSIAPGMITTRKNEALYADPAYAATRNAIVPMGRVGQPGDIAGAVALLLSKEAGYITGQNIAVDGGFSVSVMARLPTRKAPPQT